MFAKLIQHLILDYKVANLEKELKKMSIEVDNLKTLVVKVVSDVNAKLSTIQSAGLSDADKATIAEMTAALTDLDAKLSAPPA